MPPNHHRNNHNIVDMSSNESREYSSTKTPLSVVKFLELSLAVCCCYFHFYSFDDELVTSFLATGTFCGYCIILTAVMAGYMMKATINKRIMLFYSLLGTILFLTSGVFIIQSWDREFRTRTRDLAMAKGVVSIINGIIFFMDTIFTFRQKK